ncbi:hypothetical protein [uncultured Enterobacter sp.]|uniref:hypothetical protein n=1 Tax=uncultured Enterobacter sp. TaxID=238202 RepID=UPI002592D022|nr:hypothetical protein [uncultured Enterobacter sp.]
MRNYTNQANIIKRIAFDGLTVISDERVTSPVGMLLATTKPDEQCVFTLKRDSTFNDIIAFRRFDNTCRRMNEWLCGRNKVGAHVCCAMHIHLIIKLYAYTVLSMQECDQAKRVN